MFLVVLADVLSGETDFADIMFLVAVILAVIAAVVSQMPPHVRWTPLLGWLAVAFAAFGWLAL